MYGQPLFGSEELYWNEFTSQLIKNSLNKQLLTSWNLDFICMERHGEFKNKHKDVEVLFCIIHL